MDRFNGFVYGSQRRSLVFDEIFGRLTPLGRTVKIVRSTVIFVEP